MKNPEEHKKLLAQITELEKNSVNYFDVEKEFFPYRFGQSRRNQNETLRLRNSSDGHLRGRRLDARSCR